MSDGDKSKKICLLVFRNKKTNDFVGVNKVISDFAERGFWLNKIAYVAFNDSQDIVRALQDGKFNYENLVLCCPKEMENTLKKYVSAMYSAEFDNFGVLTCGDENAFIVCSDGENKLKIADICDILYKKYGKRIERAYIKTVGAPPKKINEAIEKSLSVCRDVEFNVIESFGDCSLEIFYKDDLPKTVFDGVTRAALTTLNDWVYALENISLEQRLVQLLKLRRMKICVAESFTGGGVCKRLVSVSGASEVFYEGLNTYSNESKSERLGVGEETLRLHGAVSEETAFEMAEGLIKQGNCDISVATTGIAGPKSDSTNKPVGLLYIAIGLKDGTAVYKYNLNGTRNDITETAINLALFHAFKAIK